MYNVYFIVSVIYFVKVFYLKVVPIVNFKIGDEMVKALKNACFALDHFL